LGYGLDVLFGTLPVFLVVFTLLGFAAGVNVMMRTSKEIQREVVAHEAAKRNSEG
jgi:ATP synthase protein I